MARACTNALTQEGRPILMQSAHALSLGLLKVEPHLSKFGGFLQVHPGPQIGLL